MAKYFEQNLLYGRYLVEGKQGSWWIMFIAGYRSMELSSIVLWKYFDVGKKILINYVGF